MRRWLTLSLTALFLGFSLLYAGCTDELGGPEDFLSCDCNAPPSPPPSGFMWQIQYLDCDSPPTATVITLTRKDYDVDASGQAHAIRQIRHCSRFIRVTQAACRNNDPQCQ